MIQSTVKLKDCAQCGNSFEPKRDFAIFCSKKCQNKAHNDKKRNFRINNGQINGTDDSLNDRKNSRENGLSTNHNGHAEFSFMLKVLETDRDRFENLYNEECEERKILEEELSNLEKEFEKFKATQAIEKIANAKPSGLSGLAENPLMMKLIDHLGPAIGKFAERMSSNGTPAQMAVNNTQP
jgi:predicted nucleic acid-binding Zn ribbon protein